MASLLLAFTTAFIISLAGSLSPSGMSATALGLTIDRNKKAGLLFGLGSAIIEMIYIRLYFFGLATFLQESDFFYILQWIMLIAFFIIGALMFVRSYQPQMETKKKQRKDFSEYSYTRAFLLGFALKAFSPMQFVFWTFWSTYLISNNWLQTTSLHYTVFCIGLGAGTFGAFAAYVFLGAWLEERSVLRKQVLMRIIAIFIGLSSAAWAIRLLM